MKNTSRTITKASRNRAAAALFALTLAIALAPQQAKGFPGLQSSGRFKNEIIQVSDLIDEWRIDEAYGQIKSMAAKDPNDAWVKFFLAKTLFMQSRYKQAKEIADSIRDEAVRDTGGDADLFDLIDKTYEATKDFTSKESEHFRLFYLPGSKDEIIVDESLLALEAAWKNLGALFDFRPNYKITVEIYPTVDDFVAVSTLSREAIKTSGTIALCKFNRLMITSPRLLHLGYRWQDTLAHEYTHYLIYKKSAAVCPVWLHEGIAIYNEERWRRDAPAAFEPSQESLLASGIRKGQLVTLSRMHPSFALLSGKNESALAFAEVYKMIAYMEQKYGPGIQKAILEKMYATKSFNDAFSQTFGKGQTAFYDEWEKWIEKQSLKEIPGIEVQTVKLKEGEDYDSESEEESLTLDIGQEKAQDHSRIGDLLMMRGRVYAAIDEYGKAAEDAPASAIVFNKLGKSQVRAALYTNVSQETLPGAPKKPEETDLLKKSLDNFEKAVSLRPSFPNAYANLGVVNAHLGRYEEAAKNYLESLAINPFNPFVQESLANIYGKMGKTAEMNKRLQIVEKLKG